MGSRILLAFHQVGIKWCIPHSLAHFWNIFVNFLTLHLIKHIKISLGAYENYMIDNIPKAVHHLY